MSDTNPQTKPLFGLRSDGKPLEIPIIGLCGSKGSGKTLAGLTLCPEETIEIGIEDSGVTYSLPLKKRFSMYREVTGKDGEIPKPAECWAWFEGIIKQIRTGDLKCRVLFVDPITDIQSGLVEYVKQNAAKFGRTANQYEKASGLLWADVKAYAKMLLGTISTKCTFMFTAHMGSVWANGAPVAGKTKSKGMDTFYELASLYLYLTRDIDPQTGKQPGAPVAFCCPPHGKSRLAHNILTPDGEHEIKPILPPRIENFTWKRLREYVATPPDYGKLKKSELAQAEVLSADDRLLLEHDRARMELEAAQLREQQMEMARAAAEKNSSVRITSDTLQAALSKPAKAAPKQAESAVAAEPKPEPKPEPVTAVAEEPKVAEEAEPPFDSSDVNKVLESVLWLIEDLNMTPEQVAKACQKRGVENVQGLSLDKLSEFRLALRTAHDKRQMELKKPPKK